MRVTTNEGIQTNGVMQVGVELDQFKTGEIWVKLSDRREKY